METIIIRLDRPDKALLLMELLKSLDFITHVEYFDKFAKGKKILEAINQVATESDLQKMTKMTLTLR